MKFTPAQQTIISHPIQPHEVVKVHAFAGTGKTSTLIYFSQARLKMRFLYVAFNKSVQLEAAGKFPSHVICKTAHSLAWRGFGSRFKHKLEFGLKANTVMDALELEEYEAAKFTLETLHRFLVSADPTLYSAHVPPLARLHYPPENMPDFVSSARTLWAKMTNELDKSVPMIHDGYLKMYQLSKPRLNFDCILLDEAQDISPVIADIVLSQGCVTILVGDPHQAIYGWRGAQDTMQKVDATTTLYLAHSFRFGKNVASLANKILHTFKGEKEQLFGLNGSGKLGRVKGQYTILARTNGALFSEAAELIKNYKLGFIGGIHSYQFGLLVDTYHLFNNQHEKIQDSYIRGFPNYPQLKKFAEEVEDFELMSRCRIVDKFEQSIPSLVNEIIDKAVDPKHAQICLSTAHKSKGLEFDKVKLSNDFTKLLEDEKLISTDKTNSEEFNLVYVAVTRVRESLEINDRLKVFIDWLDSQPGNN
ncbi:MAG: UvrD-helicase domain-containing protein [SAR324 cluster bacterium]|nr:UvrD-helicase domain-containing protein [SAR324 cluster bacterium]